MTDARDKFRKEWEYFFSRLNLGASFLDARAIKFMNELNDYLDEIENEAVILAGVE